MEFGHKVLLCETAEKFITDYEVYEKQPPDSDLTQPVIERHEKLFAERPKVLASSQAFRAGIEGTISGLKRFSLGSLFFPGVSGVLEKEHAHGDTEMGSGKVESRGGAVG